MDEGTKKMIAEVRKILGDRKDWGYLDEHKNVVPCSLADLIEHCGMADFFEHPDHFVADDYYGEMRVSTIFLHLDHNFFGRIAGFGGSPQWFETMVFDIDGHRELWCKRYATYADAVAGHADALNHVMLGFK